MPHRLLARRAAGLTLLDLLVALSVLAILVALAVPPLSRAERRAAAGMAARELRADLARTRIRAILDGSTAWVEIDTAAGRYQVVDGSGRRLLERVLPPGVVLKTTAHRQSIPFTARGTSNLYSTTSIGIPADPDARWHVLRVAPTGSVEVR